MELLLEEGTLDSFLIQLIVSYLKLSQRRKVKIVHLSQGALKAQKQGKFPITIPSIITTNGDIIGNATEISKFLLSVLPQWRQFFLGSNQQQQKQINDIKTHLKSQKQVKKYLQKHLDSKTFFVSNHLTFADFFMFTNLYDSMIQITDDQKIQYNNVFRWYKHVQNLPEILAYLNCSKRFIVCDPQRKINFLAEKKKSKKDQKKQLQNIKKEENKQGKEEKKEQCKQGKNTKESQKSQNTEKKKQETHQNKQVQSDKKQ